VESETAPLTVSAVGRSSAAERVDRAMLGRSPLRKRVSVRALVAVMILLLLLWLVWAFSWIGWWWGHFMDWGLVYSVTLSFLPDGKTLATGHWDGRVRVWNTDTGRCIRAWWGDSTGHSLGVVVLPDGKSLATEDNGLKLWRLSTGALLRTLDFPRASDIAFSPDGRTLAGRWGYDRNGPKVNGIPTVVSVGQVKLWDVATWRWKRTVEWPTAGIESFTFSPDGKTLAGGTGDGTVALWDVETGVLTRALKVPKSEISAHPLVRTGVDPYSLPEPLRRNLQAQKSRVLSVAFSRDGKTLAAGSDEGNVTLWNAQTGERLRTLASTGSALGKVAAVAFSPDGTILASSHSEWFSNNGELRLWEVHTGKSLSTLTAPEDVAPKQVAFSPDGTHVRRRSSAPFRRSSALFHRNENGGIGGRWEAEKPSRRPLRVMVQEWLQRAKVGVREVMGHGSDRAEGGAQLGEIYGHDYRIEGNRFLDNRVGIRLADAREMIIRENEIRDNVEAGILLERCLRITIEANRSRNARDRVEEPRDTPG
jgi:parallel beta-helix repeat protein